MQMISHHYLFLFLIFIVTFLTHFTQGLPVDWSLVAYFPFNGNAEDQTGLGSLQPHVVKAVLTTDRFGNANTAYMFDDSSSYIYYIVGERFRYTKGFSVSFWIRPTADGVVFDMGFEFNQGFRIIYHAGVIYFKYVMVGGIISSASSSVIVDEWNHVVFSKSTTVLEMYVNNDLVLSQPSTRDMLTQANLPFVMGGQPITSTFPPTVPSSTIFGGKIDDVCFYWSRLSSYEVSLLFNYPFRGPVPTRAPTPIPTFTPSSTAVPTQILTPPPTFSTFPGLYAYYPFDGDATDASRNLIHGTAFNTTPTTDRFGDPNGALWFDGRSSYVMFPVGHFRFTTSMSISFWMRAAANTDWLGVFDFTHSYYGGGLVGGWYVFLNGDKIGYDYVSIGKIALNETAHVSIPFDEWAHVAITKSWTCVTIYVNGKKATFNAFTITTTTISNRDEFPLVIGAENFATRNSFTSFTQNYFFKGSLDDVNIYYRELSESEVQQLYANSSSNSNQSASSSTSSSSLPIWAWVSCGLGLLIICLLTGICVYGKSFFRTTRPSPSAVHVYSNASAPDLNSVEMSQFNGLKNVPIAVPIPANSYYNGISEPTETITFVNAEVF